MLPAALKRVGYKTHLVGKVCKIVLGCPHNCCTRGVELTKSMRYSGTSDFINRSFFRTIEGLTVRLASSQTVISEPMTRCVPMNQNDGVCVSSLNFFRLLTG